MKMAFFLLQLFTSVLCFPHAVLAEIIGQGGAQVDPVAYPYACTVHVSNELTSAVSHCSATVVDEKHIQTAAHCFTPHFKLDRDHTVAVNCAGQFLANPAKIILPEGLTENMDASGKWDVPLLKDKAIIEYRSAIHFSALPRATDKAIYFDDEGKLRAGVTCEVFGYGNTGDRTTGFLHHATYEGVSIVLTGANGIQISAPGGADLVTSVDEGDSGGTFMCTAPGHRAELVGVINAFSYPSTDARRRIANFMVPIWD
jgi:hypothetical protein